MHIVPPAGSQRPHIHQYLRNHELALTNTEIATLWGRRRLRTEVGRGDIVPIHTGVYVASDQRGDILVRTRALLAWEPRALMTGAIALHLLNSSNPRPTVIDAVAPNGHHDHTPAHIRLHQTGPLPRVIAPHAIPCVTPQRALFDAWKYAPAPGRTNLLYVGLWSGVCTWHQLYEEVEAAARVPQRRRLMQILDDFAAGATSPLEVRAKRDVFVGPDFAQFERQAEIILPTRTVRADMLHRASRVVVELDGERYHSDARSVAADNERTTELAAAGYLTMRFSWDDVVNRPAWCRKQVLAAVAMRLPGRSALPRSA